MNRQYKEYRRWLDNIESRIRLYMPGCNIALHESRKGYFELMVERPLGECFQCDHDTTCRIWKDVYGPQVIAMRLEQVEDLEHASREEVEAFIGDYISRTGPLGA